MVFARLVQPLSCACTQFEVGLFLVDRCPHFFHKRFKLKAKEAAWLVGAN